MKAYKTWFTNKWEIEEVETDDLKPLGRTGKFFTKVTKSGEHYGTIYENPLYRTEEAARKYINKEYVSDEEKVILQG